MFHRRDHQGPLLVPVLNQLNPLHNLSHVSSIFISHNKFILLRMLVKNCVCICRFTVRAPYEYSARVTLLECVILRLSGELYRLQKELHADLALLHRFPHV